MLAFDWTHAQTERLPGAVLLPGREIIKRLWRETGEERLPFLTMRHAEELTERLGELEPWLRGFRHMLVLGIGGSALGARALQKAFFPRQDRPGHDGPFLWILDNVDADELSAMLACLPPEETLVTVVSKSGGTIETLAQYFLVRQWLQRAVGTDWTRHLALITDAEKGFLREEARRLGCLSLPIPEHLGGRYSIFSAVGLFPAAFLGLDWRGLLAGARESGAALVCPERESLAAHPAWQLATWAHALMENGYSQLIFFMYVPAWAAFGQWFAQLWAESLGKNGRGSMPVPAVGVTDQHSLQQMFLDGPKDKGCIQILASAPAAGEAFPDDLPPAWSWLCGRRFGELLDAECLGAAAAMARHGLPLVRVRVDSPTPHAAGRFMGLCMAATLLTGWLLDINPLDQPAVELGKRLALARLGADGHEAEGAMLADFADK